MTPMAPLVSDGPSAALARLADAHDDAAWAWLVAHEGPRLFQAAWRVLGDRHAAEDAVQEALLHIRRSAGRFTPPLIGDADDAARAWLYRVGVSAARMWQRGELRRHQREHHNALPQSGAAADPRLDQLRAAIADLPEDQRLPLLLHHCGGHDYDTVATTLGISAGAARVRVHRAVERLRQRLAPLGMVVAVSTLLSELSAHEPTLTQATVAQWQSLPFTTTPVATSAAIFGGMTTMTKLSIAGATLLALGLITATAVPTVAEEHKAPAKEEKHAEPKKEGHDAMKEGTKGVSQGTIVSNEKGKLILKTEDGDLLFMPNWIGGNPADGGGLDKEVLKKMEAFKAGQKVKISWFWSERRRVETISAL